MTLPAVATLTERLPEPAVEVCWASRLTAVSSNGRARDSNSQDEGSIPSTAAIYVDDASGASVTEDYWPGDPVPESENGLS